MAGSLLIGLAFAALLPPFEGFDEDAHYSYIQQLAQTGQWPRFGDKMSKEIDAYQAAAPALGYVPWKYGAFFDGPADAIATMRDIVWQPPNAIRAWHPGLRDNWQAQHPPLYYALMAPLYRVTAGWSLADQLLTLRLASYLLAWAGLCIAAFSFAREKFENAAVCALALALWPVLFPMWFPEMARLGNDSLVVFICACALPLSMRVAIGTARGWHYVLLALLIGLGLLTKATFLPFAAAIGTIMLIRAAVSRDAGTVTGVLILPALALAVCGWWYVGKFIETGNLIGSNDLTHLANTTIDDSNSHLLAKLPLLFAQTFIWYGSWSGMLAPRFWVYPLLLSSLVLVCGFFPAMRRPGIGAVERLSLLTLVTFLASLTYLAIKSRGGVGGNAWYLHGFAPVLAPLLGLCLVGVTRARAGRTVLTIACIVPLIFLPGTLAFGALYFAGCGTNMANAIYYDVSSAVQCAGQLTTILDRLNVLSRPKLVLVLFSLGWAILIAGVAVTWRGMSPNVKHP